MLSFAQFLHMHNMVYRAISIIPHVDNGMIIPSGKSPDDVFRKATYQTGIERTKEVHVDPIKKQTYTFDWVYAAPLKNPSFTQ